MAVYVGLKWRGANDEEGGKEKCRTTVHTSYWTDILRHVLDVCKVPYSTVQMYRSSPNSPAMNQDWEDWERLEA